MTVAESDIVAAIHQRRCLRVIYRGEALVVEPYAFGTDAAGDAALRVYQVEGEGPSQAPGWRLYRLDEIAELALLGRGFSPDRAGYLRNDPALTKIYAEI